MNVEIVTIGDELLLGHIVNTNAAWMSRQLDATGISVNKVTTIGDSPAEILATFRRAWKENDVVLVTGGLGPTHDDISKDAVVKFFRKPLVLHKPTLKAVRERFAKLGYEKMPEVNVGQAMVPQDFKALQNDRGTAPGLLYHEDGKTFIILPGVPVEMEFVMTNGVLPYLHKQYKSELEIIRHRAILTTGIGESMLVEKLGDPKEFLNKGTSLAFLPKAGSVRLRITSRGKTARAVMSEIAHVEKIIRDRAGEYVFGVDDDTIEMQIVKLLTARGKTLSTAESCTGGLIAAKITDVSGASAVYVGSIVAYDDRVKIGQLSVSKSTLDREGAVSEQTAIEMAEGALSRLGSDYALGVTGTAGPRGGTPEKPVGTIWIALAELGEETITKNLQLDFGRTLNRERAAVAAMEMLRRRMMLAE